MRVLGIETYCGWTSIEFSEKHESTACSILWSMQYERLPSLNSIHSQGRTWVSINNYLLFIWKHTIRILYISQYIYIVKLIKYKITYIYITRAVISIIWHDVCRFNVVVSAYSQYGDSADMNILCVVRKLDAWSRLPVLTKVDCLHPALQ